MRQLLVGSLASLALLAVSVVPLGAQHAVDPSALSTSVTAHAAEQDANRAVIRATLARPEVRDVAEKAGLDIDHANAVVNTLDGPTLDRAATIARQVDQQLSGGSSTVIISTTTIIIVLLVVILLVVALN